MAPRVGVREGGEGAPLSRLLSARTDVVEPSDKTTKDDAHEGTVTPYIGALHEH